MLELIARQPPDLVVVSGDLTQRAKPEQFRAARRFVDRIPVPVLVVPGNHDVPLYRFWERFWSPFGAYRKHFARDLEPVYRDDALLVVGINTAHGWTFTGGRFRGHRLREVGELLAAAPESACKIVVAHHHLVPPRRFDEQSVSRNAWTAIELFASAGVELVLSGHQHQGFVASSEEFYPRGREPVVIVHSGTTTSDRGRGAEAGVNSCCRIEISHRRLEISHLRWQPDAGRFAESSRHLYPRRGLGGLDLEEATE